MKEQIISALGAVPVRDLSRAEWITVGMALKEEGFPCSVWDEWSRDDIRYHPGECGKKWASFRGSSNPVKGGTIVQMAKDRGWQPSDARNTAMGWNDEIEYDGVPAAVPEPEITPAEELAKYIRTLFKPGDHVGYVTQDVYWDDEDQKWAPKRGAYDQTAKELLDSLEKHPDDLGMTVGDWKPEVGAWIRFNPLDGKGVKQENVTAFRYALVESDTLSVEEQDELYRNLELPVAALVYSGGKSLHAVVHIDAANQAEYRKRVAYLYDFLDKHGCTVDRQNSNPNRMSRMPGVDRNGKHQKLIAVNIGRKNWDDWVVFAEDEEDDLPPLESLSDYKDNPPELPEELISGILRRGHKMLVSGSSKAGKSFLLMELCIGLAEGKTWLGFPCRKSRVLYVNLEIDPASCINRFLKIYEALGWPEDHIADIELWNLRGHAIPMDKLVPKLIRRTKDRNLDAIVIDPIYKVITGDENKASDMGYFCNQFDRVARETGCSVIYCHHHSKGAQGAKRAMDRASGSGVFARDPDAQLDMIYLEMTDDVKNNVRDGNATPWRMESSLREFPNIQPVNFWFQYPLHVLDTTGELEKLSPEGSPGGNLAKSSKFTTPNQRRTEISNAFDACSISPPVTVKAMAEYLEKSTHCIYDRLKELSDEYWVKGGVVGRKSDGGKTE